jgi:hypothetical protein
MAGPFTPIAAKALKWFVSAVGGGVIGIGLDRSLSDDQEKLAFDQLLADVRALCNRQGSGARQMRPSLFRFSRKTQSGSTEYVLLEFVKPENTILVSVTNSSGTPVMRQQAVSPTTIMNSYMPSHNNCRAPSAIIRSAR